MGISIRLTVGDVIDLRGAYVRKNDKGQAGLLCVIRDEEKKTNITVLADEKYQDLITGRVTKINSVHHVLRRGRNGKWNIFTNVYVDLENAFGETPKYKAESDKIYTMTRTRADTKSDKTWVRPEFATGEEDAKEET